MLSLSFIEGIPRLMTQSLRSTTDCCISLIRKTMLNLFYYVCKQHAHNQWTVSDKNKQRILHQLRKCDSNRFSCCCVNASHSGVDQIENLSHISDSVRCICERRCLLVWLGRDIFQTDEDFHTLRTALSVVQLTNMHCFEKLSFDIQ